MCHKILLGATLVLVAHFCFSQTTVTWGPTNNRTETRDDAGSYGASTLSGFYDTDNASATGNYPIGSSGWWHLLDVRHRFYNNYAMQFSGSFFDQNLFFRKTNGIASTPWSRVMLEDPNGSASIGRVLTRSIAYSDGDKFSYNNNVPPPNTGIYTINNYGLEWYKDSWANGFGPTAWLSGFGGIKFFTGSNNRMCITVSGNVGIGTTTPPERLSVEGNIACRRLKVTQSPWPDYVFDKNYNLRNLNAVAAYIQHHRHLPDVPAAAQIAKDGLDLGENQAVLLRKVEELTLYVIQLNQAVNQLQVENKQQRRTIAALARRK